MNLALPLDPELARVDDAIGDAVIRFCERLTKAGVREFRGTEIERDVCAATGCTPGSPLRILRLKAASGEVRARLVSRRESRYELPDVAGATPSRRNESRRRPALSAPSPPAGTGGNYVPRPSWECTCGCREQIEAGALIVRCFG